MGWSDWKTRGSKKRNESQLDRYENLPPDTGNSDMAWGWMRYSCEETTTPGTKEGVGASDKEI